MTYRSRWVLKQRIEDVSIFPPSRTFPRSRRDRELCVAGEFEERYSQLTELGDGTTPFHYGTHYSSAMIVVGYLVRLRPFTESYLDLQGGAFDHADRMFWSIPKAWESSSKYVRQSVGALFLLTRPVRRRVQAEPLRRPGAHPRVLLSSRLLTKRKRSQAWLVVIFVSALSLLMSFDAGTRQGNSAPIDDVVLPPWAKNDPRRFVELHREVRFLLN